MGPNKDPGRPDPAIGCPRNPLPQAQSAKKKTENSKTKKEGEGRAAQRRRRRRRTMRGQPTAPRPGTSGLIEKKKPGRGRNGSEKGKGYGAPTHLKHASSPMLLICRSCWVGPGREWVGVIGGRSTRAVGKEEEAKRQIKRRGEGQHHPRRGPRNILEIEAC
jgi:hypothetical protein